MELTEQENIVTNIRTIREKAHAAAKRAGRNPADIQILAVTKTYDAEHIIEAVKAGITHIGENKVQEAREKLTELETLGKKPAFQFHLIGHLQTNKARQAVEMFDMIHSIDSFALAKEIDRRAYIKDRVIPILIQVNTSREKSKYGLDPDNTLEAVKQIAELKNVRIKGLMTIGALSATTAGDADKIRGYFRKLREMRDFLRDQKIPNVEMELLSMGMSSDFEIAIEEGSNFIRIGTAIFGKRKRAVKSTTLKPEEKP